MCAETCKLFFTYINTYTKHTFLTTASGLLHNDVSIYTHVYIHTYTQYQKRHTYTCIQTHIHTYTNIYLHTHTKRALLCLSKCLLSSHMRLWHTAASHSFLHIYIYIYIYIHTHTQLYQESLVVLIKVLGGSHVLVANTKNNIAGIYLKQGKCEEALQCYMEALDVKLKVCVCPCVREREIP